MKVVLAEKYGFCFGVKRAISIAEQNPNSTTIGPLIHNPNEINRLKEKFNVKTAQDIDDIDNKKAIVRTHGIEKDKLKTLKEKKFDIIDATCPFVTKPQKIVEELSQDGYDIVIFGDEKHPEVKGVKSYCVTKAVVAMRPAELFGKKLKDKIAVVSQTTKKIEDFLKIVDYLVKRYKEVRVFNTICNATFPNQSAAKELAKNVDIVLVIGGKNSSNTKQLHKIASEYCKDSHLNENADEINKEWFKDKKICGITAGASTPDWIVRSVVSEVEKI